MTPLQKTPLTPLRGRTARAGALLARALPPRSLIAAWPPLPLAALVSHAGPATTGRARWSILASPSATYRLELDHAGTPRSRWLAPPGVPSPPFAFTHEPLEDLRRLLAWTADPAGGAGELASGWIGHLSYDLGALLEPAVLRGRGGRGGGGLAPAGGPFPLIELHRCERTLVHDRQRSEWLTDPAEFQVAPPSRAAAPTLRIGRFRSGMGRATFEDAVARAVEYIGAGDAFQVNLSHRLSAGFEGSARSLFLRMVAAARPWYGAYLESPPWDDSPERRAILSMSPELFMHADLRPGAGRLTTRPMKGTRPARPGARLDLAASAKDAAELNMIIDLMRNDLGRICRYGSVRVSDPRAIERHGAGRHAVLQGVATVEGVLRRAKGGEGPDIADLLAAAFPPGSITGAPKVRAMQIIDELEPVARGPYCGCIGFFADSGLCILNVAIRTATIRGHGGGVGGVAGVGGVGGPKAMPGEFAEGVLEYSIGAGIVADSDPRAEWRETLDKAGVLRAIGGAP